MSENDPFTEDETVEAQNPQENAEVEASATEKAPASTDAGDRTEALESFAEQAESAELGDAQARLQATLDLPEVEAKRERPEDRDAEPDRRMTSSELAEALVHKERRLRVKAAQARAAQAVKTADEALREVDEAEALLSNPIQVPLNLAQLNEKARAIHAPEAARKRKLQEVLAEAGVIGRS